MAKKAQRGRGKPENPRKYKKKTSPLVIEKVEYVDYKDVDLLSRFMSDRAKIRNMRVSGNNRQQQLEVAKAIKIAREMACCYARRHPSAAGGAWPRRAASVRCATRPRSGDDRRGARRGAEPEEAATPERRRRPEHEGDPPLRPRRSRQARRHRRGR